MSAVMAPVVPAAGRFAADGAIGGADAAGGRCWRSWEAPSGLRPELALVGDRRDLRRRRPSRAVRRRRTAVAGVAAVAVLLLALPPGAFGAHGAATQPGPPITSATYTVAPGDSLWSIAQRADLGGDPRVLVDRIEARTGSSTVYPGEVLSLR